MPVPSRIALALQNPVVQGWLRRLNINVAAGDLDLASGFLKVYELVRVRLQITQEERKLGEMVAGLERDDVVLLGSTEAVEGFLAQALKTVQFKSRSNKAPTLQPGGVVDAFLDASRNARSKGWRDVWLYIAVSVPKVAVRERWGRRGTQPIAQQSDFDGAVSKVVVFCSDGPETLPLRPPG